MSISIEEICTITEVKAILKWVNNSLKNSPYAEGKAIRSDFTAARPDFR